ncbi:hypothetical protein BJ984_001360 [Herbiconiux flava]|uniref:Uncharacterized protein n=1 Tax=Herbiconiux flava TaxID=881268 RepID=A0A852SN03_9MICO|nr:hypothetical protein [Herbiconiux flava]
MRPGLAATRMGAGPGGAGCQSAEDVAEANCAS